MERNVTTYAEYSTAQEKGMKLRSQGAVGIRITKTPAGWELSYMVTP